MNIGKKFEEDFKKSIPENVYKYRLPDPACSFNKTERFSRKNPFDLFCFNGTHLYALELKTIGGTSIPYYKEGYRNPENGIKKHQIEELTKISKFPGTISGVIIDFRKFDECYFIPIKQLNLYINENKKTCSLNIKAARKIGIKINKKIKRTRYTYLLSDFFWREIL